MASDGASPVGKATRAAIVVAGIGFLSTVAWQTAPAAELDWTLPRPGVSGRCRRRLPPGRPPRRTPCRFSRRLGGAGGAGPGRSAGLEQSARYHHRHTEQRFRFDGSEQQAGNGADTRVTDGGKGLDLIVSNSNELRIAAPPSGCAFAAGKGAFTGFGDWAFMRVKQPLASSPASGDNYFVTVWLQVQAPTGTGPLTTTPGPTADIRVRKGRGDRYAGDRRRCVAGLACRQLGDQIQSNVAVQYDLMTILPPEFEVNSTHYVGGQRAARNRFFDRGSGARTFPVDRPRAVHDRTRLSVRGLAELPAVRSARL